MAVDRHGRRAVRLRLAAPHPRRPLARHLRCRGPSLRPAARISRRRAHRAAWPRRLLRHAAAARRSRRSAGGDRDPGLGAPPHRQRRAIQGSRSALGSRRRSRPPAAHATPAARARRRWRQCPLPACGTRTVARPSRDAAAAGRGAPRAGRVRPDAVGEVGGDRDPEHPRMAGPRDRRLDQTRPPRRHHHHPTTARRRARLRPLRALGPDQPHLDAARQRAHLERRSGDRAADGLGRARWTPAA